MDVVRDTVEKSKKEIENTIGTHTIDEVTFTSGYTVDTALNDTKIRFEDNVTRLHDAMAKKQKAIDDLKMPSEEVPSKKTVLKQTEKYAVIGGFVGGFLAVLWASALFLLGDRMPDEETLKNKYGVRVIGSYHTQRGKKVFSFVDSWIDLFEGIKKSDYNKETAYQLAAADLDSGVNGDMNVLVVGTVSKEELYEVWSKLVQYTEQKAFTLTEGGNLAEDPSAIRKLSNADAVVFIENRENTKYSRFIKTWELVKTQNKVVLGMFLV